MPSYRLFCLDGTRIVERCDIDADDDAEAIALVVLRGEKSDCELWCGDRRVATMPRGQIPVWAAAGAPPERRAPGLE